MLRILCTGDSHTWGQGATGQTESLDPPAVAGDRRLTGFSFDCYVDCLRRETAERTGSSFAEWDAEALAKAGGLEFVLPFARLTGRLTLPFSGALLRLEYALDEAPCAFTAEIDGVSVGGGELPARAQAIDCRLLTVPLTEGVHTLTLTVSRGVLPLYRLETYAGAVAVVNGGVGSCPSFRYRETHMDEIVRPLRPDIVLCEAHTINDWIDGAPPQVYEERLVALLREYQSLGAAVTLMTVMPILGDQRWQGGALYADYVEASRRAAATAGVPLCDANAAFEKAFSGLSAQEIAEQWYYDPWHPSSRGHGLYAKLLADALTAQGRL